MRTWPWLVRWSSRSASSAVTAAAGIFGRLRVVHGHAGVGQAEIRAADGADEHGNRSVCRAKDGRGHAIDHRLAVGFKAVALGGEALVELFVEEQNFAFDRIGAERLEVVEGVDDDDVGGESVGGRCDAAAEGGEDDLLRGVGRHPRPRDELAGLRSAHPVGDAGFFERDLCAERTHLGGDELDRCCACGEPLSLGPMLSVRWRSSFMA